MARLTRRCTAAHSALLCLFAVFSTAYVKAATYYVDPASGSMSNAGSYTNPWSTLEAVFAARKSFSPGDVLVLRNGYHGAPIISGHPGGTVTVRPEEGHVPRLRRLVVAHASHWTLSGLDISPLHAGSTSYDTGKHVDIQASSSYIALQDSRIRSVFSVAGWSATDWNNRVGGALVSSAPYSQIIGNRIENVSHGIYITKSAQHSVVAHNIIKNLRDDGFRGLASYCKFEYNTLMNMYSVTDNHDDAFQSYTNGPNGVGTETIYNVELRGNVFISFTDPNQPYKSKMQGIGCFDGMFENWIVENNVIVTDMWHGLAFYGATNCRIVNNTVVKNPINAHGYTPWIQVNPHKNGTPSRGNVVYNNLTSDMNITASVGTVEYNIESKDYAGHFVDWSGFDLRLEGSSPAVNAGTTAYAPAIDADARSRSAPYDVGAYEYQSATLPEPEDPDAVISSGSWNHVAFPQQSGSFTLSYEATPSIVGVDAVTGLSLGAASGYTDLAAIVRFAPTGLVDARNGDRYEAVGTLAYLSGLSYRVSIEVNLSDGRYSATVTPAGGTTVVIADNYAFRTEQGQVAALDSLSLYATGGGISVRDLTVTTQPPPEEPAPEEPPPSTSIISNGTWEGISHERQTGLFSIAYQASVSQSNVDAVSGLSLGLGDSWSDLAAIVRFAPNGTIDARNGGSYAAANPLLYTPGLNYGIAISVDLAAGRYTATVTPTGGSPVVIADNFAFRTEQANVAALDSLSLYAMSGTLSVSGVTIVSGGTESPPTVSSEGTWEATDFASQSGVFTLAYDATVSNPSIDAVTGLSLGRGDAWTDLAAIVRFAPSGVIDARNGGSYQATNNLVYSPNTAYRIVMSIDVPARRYSATVTPAGGSPVVIASNFAFRTEQGQATTLDTLSLYATGGSVSVGALTIVQVK